MYRYCGRCLVGKAPRHSDPSEDLSVESEDATMTVEMPSETKDTDAPSTAPLHDRASMSQKSSGVDLFVDDNVEDFVEQPHGWHNASEKDYAEKPNVGYAARRVSADLASRLQEELNAASGQRENEEESRRSSSQEQNLESQYSPINAAPVNGQMCR